MADCGPYPRNNIDAQINIVPSEISTIGKVWFIIVFESIYPYIVVHVYTEQILGPIGVIS